MIRACEVDWTQRTKPLHRVVAKRRGLVEIGERPDVRTRGDQAVATAAKTPMTVPTVTQHIHAFSQEGSVPGLHGGSAPHDSMSRAITEQLAGRVKSISCT
jgi:hypothetical protein